MKVHTLGEHCWMTKPLYLVSMILMPLLDTSRMIPTTQLRSLLSRSFFSRKNINQRKLGILFQLRSRVKGSRMRIRLYPHLHHWFQVSHKCMPSRPSPAWVQDHWSMLITISTFWVYLRVRICDLLREYGFISKMMGHLLLKLLRFKVMRGWQERVNRWRRPRPFSLISITS